MDALAVCLCIVSVVCAISTVLSALIITRAFVRVVRHIEDMMQIGGTPVGMAKMQTEFEMRRADDAAREQARVHEELKAALAGRENSNGIKDVLG